MTIETFAPALAIILGAYFIRGITGFGSGLIAVPLLALILPLQTVVPLVLVLDLCASLIMSHKARAHVQWAEIVPLLPASLLGIIVGATLLQAFKAEIITPLPQLALGDENRSAARLVEEIGQRLAVGRQHRRALVAIDKLGADFRGDPSSAYMRFAEALRANSSDIPADKIEELLVAIGDLR